MSTDNSSGNLMAQSTFTFDEMNVLGLTTGVPEFVKKLFRILEDDSYRKIILWGDAGDSFIVCDQNELSKNVLPQHFKHNNFASFVRQLNKYDFHKLKSTEESKKYGDSIWEFQHPFFKHNRPDLLEKIKRKPPLKTRLSQEQTLLNGNKLLGNGHNNNGFCRGNCNTNHLQGAFNGVMNDNGVGMNGRYLSDIGNSSGIGISGFGGVEMELKNTSSTSTSSMYADINISGVDGMELQNPMGSSRMSTINAGTNLGFVTETEFYSTTEELKNQVFVLAQTNNQVSKYLHQLSGYCQHVSEEIDNLKKSIQAQDHLLAEFAQYVFNQDGSNFNPMSLINNNSGVDLSGSNNFVNNDLNNNISIEK
ncbi:hypothetical protein BB559_005604 [Furculomyces boomerangus]|uniref:HSF-type DNA-binding domain-containing protein n=2 Tax=Harpellales TaxID=61421 RepID=A0A2T9Y7M7_9FUNG|nr:hypothetical protein BB559_005604 [Furculomyces boomerangus]PVZ96794.1 hypothetical protein BB558_007276 [Smittium angustum]